MAYGNGYNDKKEAEKKANAEALSELKRRIADGDTEGLYIFCGDEEYMKRFYYTQLCKSAGDSVNVSVLRGEMDFGELCDNLVSVPMTEFSFLDEGEAQDSGTKRVVKLDSPDFSKLSDKERSELCDLLCDVGRLLIVVIYYSDIEPIKGKNATAFLKQLSENALTVTFDRAMPGDASLLRWIKKHFDKDKIAIGREEVRYLCDSVGTDMCLLASETEKLCAYLAFHGRNEVTRADIDAVCIKNVEAITFDVTNALVARSFEGAVRALSRLRLMKTEPLMIFGAITKTVGDLTTVQAMLQGGFGARQISAQSKINIYAVEKYVTLLMNTPRGYVSEASRLCLDADARLKRGGDGYIVLENLLFRLIK